MEKIVVLDQSARYNHHLKVCDQCWHAKYQWFMCTAGQALQALSRP